MIFITGGVRSGKSSFAERVAVETATAIDGNLHYIATGVSSDAEMKDRIRRHQMEREMGLHKWKTWERQTEVGLLASSFHKKDIVLLDCVTTLVNNELFLKNHEWKEAELLSIWEGIWLALIEIQSQCHELILVSNEVFYEQHSPNELVITYNKMLGHLHQEIVNMANRAYRVEMGIPMLMKGEE